MTRHEPWTLHLQSEFQTKSHRYGERAFWQVPALHNPLWQRSLSVPHAAPAGCPAQYPETFWWLGQQICGLPLSKISNPHARFWQSVSWPQVSPGDRMLFWQKPSTQTKLAHSTLVVQGMDVWLFKTCADVHGVIQSSRSLIAPVTTTNPFWTKRSWKKLKEFWTAPSPPREPDASMKNAEYNKIGRTIRPPFGTQQKLKKRAVAYRHGWSLSAFARPNRKYYTSLNDYWHPGRSCWLAHRLKEIRCRIEVECPKCHL